MYLFILFAEYDPQKLTCSEFQLLLRNSNSVSIYWNDMFVRLQHDTENNVFIPDEGTFSLLSQDSEIKLQEYTCEQLYKLCSTKEIPNHGTLTLSNKIIFELVDDYDKKIYDIPGKFKTIYRKDYSKMVTILATHNLLKTQPSTNFLSTDGRVIIFNDNDERIEVDCLYMEMFHDIADKIDKMWIEFQSSLFSI
jgi:hypothetical protein